MDAPLVDADPPLAGLRVLDRQHGVEQPLEVEGAVAHAAEEAVAQQVVHLVDVELAGDDLGEQPLGRGAAAPGAGGGRRAVPMPSPWRAKISSISGLPSSRRVISSWSMPPSNRSSAEWLNGACPRSWRSAAARVSRRSGAARAAGQQPLALGAQGVVDPAGEVHGADHVAEAAVLGAGEDQEGEAELVDEAQPLHRPAVDQRGLQRIGADEAVDRIADGQHGRGARSSVALGVDAPAAEGPQQVDDLPAGCAGSRAPRGRARAAIR